MGRIALTEVAPIPYNISMKNTKAIFLIVVGAFIMATGFAFAEGGGVAYEQLVKEYKGIELPAPVMPAPGANKEAALAVTPATPATAATTVAVEKAPTIGETVKKYVGANFSQIVAAAAIGLIAFLVIGTGGGGLLIGLLAFSFFMMRKGL